MCMRTRAKRHFDQRHWAAIIVVLSLLLVGAATLYGIGLFAVLKGGGFDVPGSESAHAQQVLDTYLHGETPDIVILMHADGLRVTDADFQSVEQALVTKLRGQTEVSFVTQNDHFISKDGKETFVLVQLSSTHESDKENEYKTLEPLLVEP